MLLSGDHASLQIDLTGVKFLAKARTDLACVQCRFYRSHFTFIALNREKLKTFSSVTTDPKTVPLEFENNISHSHLLRTFGNKRVVYFIALRVDGMSGIFVCKCKSPKRSFNNQLTVKPSICRIYFYPLE